MAQTNYTPISLYYSATASATPSAGNLVAGELALNTNDGKLFYKDSSGVVQVLATKGGVGTSSNTQVLYNSSGLTVGSANLTFDGNSLTLGNGTYATTSKLNGSSSGTGGGTALYFQNNGTTNFAIGNYSTVIGGAYNIDAIYYLGTANNHLFYTNAAERMRITSAGNVGIGTSSPSNPLDVTGAATTNSAARSVMLATDSTSFALGVGGGITFRAKYNTAGSYFDAANIKGIKENATDGNFAGAMVFTTSPNGGSPTERMRIDSTGNVGIGTTAPAAQLEIAGYPNATFRIGDGGSGTYEFARKASDGYLHQKDVSGSYGFIWEIASSEKMRLDSSGNLLVGCTGVPTINVKGTALASFSNQGRLVVGATVSSADLAYFYSSTALAGAITVSGSVCVYTSFSDYRLKENVAPIQNALSTVAQLKPVTYKWKTDGSDGQGFIAHELQEIMPDCVTGEKDAVDENGNPKYQGVDTSFLVATLTKAIQEQQALIESLTQRIAILENK